MDRRAIAAIARLPPRSQDKLRELQLACDLALDGARSSNGRLNALDDTADARMRARLETEVSRQSSRHAVLAQVLSRVHQWLMQLPHTVVLEPVGDIAIALKPDEKLVDAVVAVRREIAALKQKLVTVKAAPLPRDEQWAHVKAYVLRLLSEVRPTVAVVGDALRVGWRGDAVAIEDTAALLCWLDPDRLARRLLDELPDAEAGAMPAAERKKCVVEIEAALLGLEQRE